MTVAQVSHRKCVCWLGRANSILYTRSKVIIPSYEYLFLKEIQYMTVAAISHDSLHAVADPLPLDINYLFFNL